MDKRLRSAINVFIALMILCCVFSCKNNNVEVCRIKYNGIKGEYNTVTAFCQINDSVSLVGVKHLYPLEGTGLYISNDQYHNWRKIYAPKSYIENPVIKEIEQISYASGALFIIQRESKIESVMNVYSTLLVSQDMGNSFDKIDYPGEMLGTCFFLSRDTFLITASDNERREHKFYMTYNGGKNWSAMSHFFNNNEVMVCSYELFLKNDILYGVFYESYDRNSARFFTYNLRTNDFHSFPPPPDYPTSQPGKIIDYYNNGICYFKKDAEILKIYEWTNNSFNLIQEIPIKEEFVEDIYFMNQSEMLIMTRNFSASFFPLFDGYDHKVIFYKSFQNGRKEIRRTILEEDVNLRFFKTKFGFWGFSLTNSMIGVRYNIDY